MCDFEKGLRNALNMVFPEAEIIGCFFHYTKALWKKAAKLGLECKEKKPKTAILISIFVILGHIPVKERNEVFIELKMICESERNEILKEFLDLTVFSTLYTEFTTYFLLY